MDIIACKFDGMLSSKKLKKKIDDCTIFLQNFKHERASEGKI